MKNLLFLLFLFAANLTLSAQQSLEQVIDSLRTQYSLYPGEFPAKEIYNTRINSLHVPPPPPLHLARELPEPILVEAYNIPAAVVRQYYPWNADSISLVCNLETDSLLKFRLADEDINNLVSNIYKYDYRILEPDSLDIRITCIEVLGCGEPIANFQLLFYHKGHETFADFYNHSYETIIDNSVVDDPYPNGGFDVFDDRPYYKSNMYWGGFAFDEIAKYLNTKYQKNVSIGLYECDLDYQIEIMDLEPREIIGE